MSCITFHNHCVCVGCVNTGPGTTGGTEWASLSSMTWDEEGCSDTYNVYRRSGGALIDTDGDGAAQEYGQCYANDVGGTGMTDSTRPPTGQMYVYAVSGQNLNGEGALGYSSSRRMRPNVSPCP